MAERTGEPGGSVGRLLHDLTIGNLQDSRAMDAYAQANGLREVELQYQFQISGSVSGAVPAFETFTINFDYALFYAPGQRESNLEEPHFTFGSHVKPAVGVLATVVEWLQDEKNGSIIGAVVGVGAVGPEVAYKGKVHLTFQGYGSLIEEDGAALANGG